MIAIKHPKFPNETREVKHAEVAGWTAAGWVRVTKKEAEATVKAEAAKADEPAKK